MSDRMVKIIVTNKDGDVLDEIRIPVDPTGQELGTADNEVKAAATIRSMIEDKWVVAHDE